MTKVFCKRCKYSKLTGMTYELNCKLNKRICDWEYASGKPAFAYYVPCSMRNSSGDCEDYKPSWLYVIFGLFKKED